MAIVLAFLLGIGNFAAHKAVLESGAPILKQVPWFFTLLGGKFSLLVEFAMLLGTLLMVSTGATGWAWFYGFYSAVNVTSAWLIVSGRI